MPVIIPDILISTLRASGNTALYPPGDPIFAQGEAASDFYIISAGRVRVYTITAGGDERTIEILEAGRVFGDSSFLTNACRSVNIEAVIASEIIRLTTEELIRLCTCSEELLRLIFQHMADTCNYLTAQIIQGTYCDAAQKVAAFLLNESANRGRRTLPYSHEEIAASVGLNRVTVSKVLSKFKKQQLVGISYRSVEILDPLRLEALLPNAAHT